VIARRDLAVVAAFTIALSLPLLFEPYTIDEPFFLAIAKHILVDPRHPLDFMYSNEGRWVPMSQASNTPLLFCYALAAALRFSGGLEWLTRALLLPFDLLAAAALYLLAARFLRRPLWPALICLAAPAWSINVGHVMAEKSMAAFSLWCLYALVRGIEERRARWYWASAVFGALALFSKYAAVFLLVPAAGFARQRGVPARRIAAWIALACAPMACCLLWDRLAGGSAAAAAWRDTASQVSRLFFLKWLHKLRAFFSFAGGCGLVTAIWPLAAYRPRRSLLWVAAGAALLFLPVFDLSPSVRVLDRVTGFLFSCGACWGVWNLLCDDRSPGRALWLPWLAGVAAFLLFIYWAIAARLVLFLLPPLVFASAENLERAWPAARLSRLYQVSFAVCLSVTVALGWIDSRFACAQRAVARQVAAEYGGREGRLWYAAPWGLGYYLEQAGARGIDLSREGWSALRTGDAAVLTRLSFQSAPPPGLHADERSLTVEEPLPLRLLSGWTGQAGFYSSAFGFLPFSISREPLAQFTLVRSL
jgi:hypothetical protein